MSTDDRVTSFRQAAAPGMGVPSALRVLVIEDSQRDAELLIETLSETAADGIEFSYRHVTKLADACETLAGWTSDVVLLDLSLPDSRGLDSLQALHAAASDVPVVVMTGLDDDAFALRAVQAGAQDYLVKGRDDGGAVRRAIRYAVERQRLVLAAREAARIRDEVLAIVSHDLRNPLSTISMCARVLLDPETESSARARELGGIIRSSSEWMERLISDLLDVARVETGALALDVEPVPPGSVIDALATMYAPLAAERDVALVARVAPDLERLHVDSDRLVQALGNLLGNALKFTPAGGRVTLAAERADGATGCTGGVHFRVADTGCGIASGDLARIFDRFWQVRGMRRGGAGLGLAIAKGIVEAHGGTIAVESAPGVGTTFTCTLPAARATDAT
ncbi:MAG TPA: ATP-binding protein [Gemmatimonadales bacterium]